MKRYELLDHTADLGIRAFGCTCKEAFANAALALFDLLTDLEQVRSNLSIAVRVEAADREELLVRFLGELLSLCEMQGYLFREFLISGIDQTSLTALVRGEKFDPSRHTLKREIKAVTYHQVEVKENRESWEVQVVFDL